MTAGNPELATNGFAASCHAVPSFISKEAQTECSQNTKRSLYPPFSSLPAWFKPPKNHRPLLVLACRPRSTRLIRCRGSSWVRSDTSPIPLEQKMCQLDPPVKPGVTGFPGYNIVTLGCNIVLRCSAEMHTSYWHLDQT